MKNKAFLLLFVCISFFGNALLAQPYKTKFGKLSDEEIEMQAYPAAPDAPAVVLFDVGNVYHTFDDKRGFIQTYSRHTRIKIFKKSAYHLADVIIPYYTGSDFIKIKASCFTIDGKQVSEIEMDKESIFTDNLTKRFALKKMLIPGVKEDCIIEFEYKIATENSFSLPEWYFQWEVPVIYSEFEASVPSFFQFEKFALGWLPFTKSEEGTDQERKNINVVSRGNGVIGNDSRHVNVTLNYDMRTFHFIQEHIPAMKKEEHMFAPANYRSRLLFNVQAVYNTRIEPDPGVQNMYRLVNGSAQETRNDWTDLGEDMLEDYYKERMDSKRNTKGLAQEACAGATTTEEKIKAATIYIAKNFSVYAHDFVGMSQSMTDLIKTKKGSPTDLNILLINLLRQNDVPAHPLMISTKNNGLIIPFHVSIFEMDRVIAAIELGDGKFHFVDLAEGVLPYGLLPSDDLNGRGLLLKKDAVIWEKIDNNCSVREAYIFDLKMDDKGGINGTVKTSLNGYAAHQVRLDAKTESGEVLSQKMIPSFAENATISKVELEDLDAVLNPTVSAIFEVEAPTYAQSTGDLIYVNPTFGLGVFENPFQASERNFDVELDKPINKVLNINIEIPEAYAVAELPGIQKVILGEKLMTFDYVSSQKGNKIELNIRIKSMESRIPVVLYADLQEYYRQIIKKCGEQLVLKKI